MPSPDRGAFNDADLRYLRGALLALRIAHRASHVAAARACDPRVRALARRVRVTHGDGIRAITSMLLVWDRHEGGPDRARVVAASLPAGDLGSVDRVEIDRRFVDLLIAHAEASLASARTELIEGFGGSSRRLAEDASRANWRELAALSLLRSPRL